MKKLESHPFYSIHNEISSLLKKPADCRQIIQSNYGQLIVRFYGGHVISSNGHSDLASFKIIPATDSIADRMARREGGDLTRSRLNANQYYRLSQLQDPASNLAPSAPLLEQPDEPDSNYDGPGDDYYESLEGGIKTTPDDMDRYKQLK